MRISNPYLFLINKTNEQIADEIGKLQNEPREIVFNNGHFYYYKQVMEMWSSIQKSEPVFYKGVDNTFIKFE